MAKTLVSLLDHAVDNYSGRTAVKSQISGIEWTYKDLQINAHRVSGVLTRLGVEKGNKVIIVSDNTPEFIAADLGTLYTGAVSIPVDQNLKPEEQYASYFNLVKPRVILVDSKHLNKVNKYANQSDYNVTIVPFDQVLAEKPVRLNVDVKDYDVSTIIFSSGTTSESVRAFKAVQLTHGNIASNILATEKLTRLAEDIDGANQGVYLAGMAGHWHSFAYMIQKAFLYSGSKLHFSDISKFTKGRAAEINPHYAIMIPKVANRIMAKVKENIAKKGEKASKYFEWFLKQSNNFHYEQINNKNFKSVEFLENLVGDKIFYSKIRKGLREKLGKNKIYLVGGSAVLPLETQLFFYSIGFPIYQGYGLTETSPVISVNLPWAYRFSSSGKVIDGDSVVIANPESIDNEKVVCAGEGKEGLIMIRGPNVFPGYFKDEKKTKEVFVNGWFNTGDLGFIENGFLHVTGRKKDLICLANGKKILPNPIETYYAAKGLDLVIVGNNQLRTGVLILADEKMKRDLGNGLEQEVLARSRIILADSKKKFGMTFFTQNVAIVSDFEAHPELVTNTMKPRRKLIEKHYNEVINRVCSKIMTI